MRQTLCTGCNSKENLYFGSGSPKLLCSFDKILQAAFLVKAHQRQGHSIKSVQTRMVLAILNWDGERNGFPLDLQSH